MRHVIVKNRMGTNQSEIDAVQSFDKPKYVKNLRSFFLGICKYYKRFILVTQRMQAN